MMHKFALLSGVLVFFIVFAPLQELDKGRLDNTSGMTLVGLAFLLGLLMLKRHIKKHMQSEEKPMTMQEIAEINLT
jgi:predicted transporter